MSTKPSDAPHHHQVPLRSAMKHRDHTGAISPAPSHPSSPAQRPLSLSASPRHSLTVDDSFHPQLHSPALLSQVPLPPSPSITSPVSLPPTPGNGSTEGWIPSSNAGSLLGHSRMSRDFQDNGLPTPVSSISGYSQLPSAATIVKSPYTPKVGFDTFENPLASMFSFTLQVKSAGYRRTRNTRVYVCAAGPDESGQEALEWALESLVQDGDELVVFRGVDEEVLEKDHNIVREEARKLMLKIQKQSAEADPQRKLSLILEYIPGKITDSIDRLIALYRPDTLVVGTRGKRGIMSVGFGGVGSISKYCLSHSPVPVIVVRPERQSKKAAEKRKADPKRGRHFETKA